MNDIPFSTPIDEAKKECTPEEWAGIDTHTPPYDGVRTYGDLLVIREQASKKKPKDD